MYRYYYFANKICIFASLLCLVLVHLNHRAAGMKIIWQPTDTSSDIYENSGGSDGETFTENTEQVPQCNKPNLTADDLDNCRNHELPTSYDAKCWMHCMRDRLPQMDLELVHESICTNTTFQMLGMYMIFFV